jgi:ATP-dependent DNA helicase
MLTKQQEEEGGRKVSKAKLNNVIMQMRKNCNHPDLVSSAFTNDMMYPTSEVLLEQSGKLQLLNRLLKKLKAKGHRVLIFSQVGTSCLVLAYNLPNVDGRGMK